MEKEACFILGLLAIKPEHQHSIADMGALAGLVGILKRHTDSTGSPMPGASVVRRAADAITNLAHENVPIKSRVRAEAGIPPLVTLLEAYDAKVDGFAALQQCDCSFHHVMSYFFATYSTSKFGIAFS